MNENIEDYIPKPRRHMNMRAMNRCKVLRGLQKTPPQSSPSVASTREMDVVVLSISVAVSPILNVLSSSVNLNPLTYIKLLNTRKTDEQSRTKRFFEQIS